MTTKSPNVFTIIRRKLRKGRSYDLSAQNTDDKEVVCLKSVNDVPTSYDRPNVNNTLSTDGDIHSHVNHNGDSIGVGPHLNGIHNNIAATIGSTPVSSPMRYCGNRSVRDETVDKSVHSCATPTKKVSCEDVNSQNQTPVKTWHSRTASEASARECLPTPDTSHLPLVAPPHMIIAKSAAVKEKVAVNSNCVCQKPQPLPEEDDVDIGGGYSVCKDVSKMQVRDDDIKQPKIPPGENSSTSETKKDAPNSSARRLEDKDSSHDDAVCVEPIRTNQKIGAGNLSKDSHHPVNGDTFDICPAGRSRQFCSSINSTGTVSVTSGDSENSTAESGEEADYTIVGDIEVQVPEDVAVAYQSPSRKLSKAGASDTRPKVKTVSMKAVTKETEGDAGNVSCDSSQPMAGQQVLVTSDSDDIFVNDDKRVYRKTTEHRLDCPSSSFSQLYASVPKGPIKSQSASESSNLLEEEGADDSSSGVVTSPDEPREMGDETGEEECEDNIPPLPSRNYTIQEGEADVNYNVKMMRSISVTSASSATSTDDEPTHMSWAEVMKEAQTLGIPLRTPSRELGEKLPNSQSTSSMDTSSSSIDTADGCTSPGGAKRPERRRDKIKLPSLVIKGGNVSISDVHAEVTTDMHRRTLPPPPRSPKSASPKVQTSTLGRPRFHSSGHLTSQEVRGSQSRNSLQSLDSGVGQSKSSVSLDTGMSKAKHSTSRESVPSTQGKLPGYFSFLYIILHETLILFN